MKLQTREIAVLAFGAIFVVGSLGWSAAKKRSANAGTGEMETALAKIRDYDRVRVSVERLAKELDVELPSAPPGDQQTAIMNDIAAKAKARGLMFGGLRPNQTTTRSGAASTAIKPIQFRVDLVGPFLAVVEFTHDLEHSRIPYVVAEARFEGGGRARGGAQPPPDPNAGEDGPPPPPPGGMVRATMKIQSYIFPVGTTP